MPGRGRPALCLRTARDAHAGHGSARGDISKSLLRALRHVRVESHGCVLEVPGVPDRTIKPPSKVSVLPFGRAGRQPGAVKNILLGRQRAGRGERRGEEEE